jgi:predicted dehydrogenase
MKRENIRVALVGLGFGAEFVPIYLHHPDVEFLAICDSNERVLAEVGDRYQVQRVRHEVASKSETGKTGLQASV